MYNQRQTGKNVTGENGVNNLTGTSAFFSARNSNSKHTKVFEGGDNSLYTARTVNLPTHTPDLSKFDESSTIGFTAHVSVTQPSFMS